MSQDLRERIDDLETRLRRVETVVVDRVLPALALRVPPPEGTRASPSMEPSWRTGLASTAPRPGAFVSDAPLLEPTAPVAPVAPVVPRSTTPPAAPPAAPPARASGPVAARSAVARRVGDVVAPTAPKGARRTRAAP